MNHVKLLTDIAKKYFQIERFTQRSCSTKLYKNKMNNFVFLIKF
jgi:hypothetical protein